MKSETRPFTAAERAMLPTGPTVPVRWLAGIGPGLGAAMITFLLSLLALGFINQTSVSAVRIAILVSVVAGFGLYGYVAAGTRRRRPGPTTWDDLQNGTARVDRFEAVDAIAVEEFEDEGLSFYVALADSRVLFLSGQYLYEAVERGEFPAERFEMVRTALTGTVLSLTPLGPPLAPIATRPPFTDAEYETGRVPSDGDVLPGPLPQYLGTRST